jgi:hypothetical protein
MATMSKAAAGKQDGVFSSCFSAILYLSKPSTIHALSTRHW